MLVHFLLIFNYVQVPSNTVLMCLNRTGDSHCPEGIFKNIISNVTKNEEAGHGLVLSLQLESAIQQYQRCERKLGFTVTDIRGKVDTIKEHFDKVLKDATTKLQVSVNVAGADGAENQWVCLFSCQS